MTRAAIHVCPLSKLAETLHATGARSVVTLLARGFEAALPRFDGVDRLTLDLSDITAPLDGHVAPAEAHVADLLRFVWAWERDFPLLIHCHAGVSRSTAAAYVATCALSPDTSEQDLADRLRTASPSATPNARIVALADAALGRRGRMIDAIRRIGRGRDCFEGEVFRLEP